LDSPRLSKRGGDALLLPVRRHSQGRFRMVTTRFALLPVGDLKTHERAEPDRVRRVMRQMRSTGMVRKAIVVDSNTMVVLDGVHRLGALQKLGAVRVPAWLVDYSDEGVVVLSKDRKTQFPKEAVIRAATKGPKLPPKSTRHTVKGKDGALVHISKLEGDVSVPLSTLMRPV
jgi:L-serine kinase (ADP)